MIARRRALLQGEWTRYWPGAVCRVTAAFRHALVVEIVWRELLN